MRRSLGVLVVVAVMALAAAPAGGIVPPSNCGKVSAKGKSYRVKADQVSCGRAKDYAQGYMATGKRPPGYGCRRFSGSALVAKCVNSRANPDRTIFIIK